MDISNYEIYRYFEKSKEKNASNSPGWSQLQFNFKICYIGFVIQFSFV